MNKKIGPYRPVHIIFVQLHIFMVPWVGTQMGGWKFSPVQISSQQFRKAWSSKRDFWRFQKTSTKSCQAPNSFSSQLKEANTLIYASVGQQTEEKDGSEEIVWNGSCTAALIDVHLCMSFFSKDVSVTVTTRTYTTDFYLFTRCTDTGVIVTHAFFSTGLWPHCSRWLMRSSLLWLRAAPYCTLLRTVTYCCSDAIVLVTPIVRVTYCSLTVHKSGLLGTLEPQTWLLSSHCNQYFGSSQ